MSDQTELFHESIYDAIGSAIQTLGGAKKAAGILWPALKSETGYTRLKHCLSDDFPEKLSPSEIVLLAARAKEKGDHSIIRFLAAELGYEAPRALSQTDQAAELQRKFVEAVQESARIAERLTRLGVKVA